MFQTQPRMSTQEITVHSYKKQHLEKLCLAFMAEIVGYIFNEYLSRFPAR